MLCLFCRAPSRLLRLPIVFWKRCPKEDRFHCRGFPVVDLLLSVRWLRELMTFNQWPEFAEAILIQFCSVIAAVDTLD
jgi:hypothetical protein